MRSQLGDQATKADQWYSRAKELEQQIEQLQQRQSHLSSPSVLQGELLDTTPESLALHREPLVAESEQLENIAIAVNPLEDVPAPAAPSNKPAKEAAPSLGSLAPLTLTELAKRLNFHHATVSRAKDKGDESFKKWSSENDPDHIAWEYRPGKKRTPQCYPDPQSVTVTPTAANHY